MKILAAFAAAGTLAIVAAPAQAVEVAPSISSNSAASNVMMIPMDSLINTTVHHYDDDWDDYDDRRYRKNRRHNRYDRNGRYREPRHISRRDRVWRGRDGRYYCKRDNGTTGLVIGAGVGALIGNEVAGRGDKLLGTLLGGVAGGLLGREIDKGDLKCR